MRSGLFLVVLIAATTVVGGCGHNIGDPCGTNVDCSPAGDRFCDTSSIGGYCTVDGCDILTCPDNSVCIRFLMAERNKLCTFGATAAQCQPVADMSPAALCCDPNERCVCDTSTNGSCVDPNQAHCAPEASERRWCMKTCGGNGDCRPGYECRSTGTFGAEPVPQLYDDLGVGVVPAQFCAPQG